MTVNVLFEFGHLCVDGLCVWRSSHSAVYLIFQIVPLLKSRVGQRGLAGQSVNSRDDPPVWTYPSP